MRGVMLARGLQLDLAMEMSPSEMQTLHILGFAETLTMSALAETLNLPLSTVTHRIDKLVKKKLIVRQRNEGDRRVVEVTLSETGRHLMQQMHDMHLAASRDMLAPLSPPERAQFVALITKINASR